MNLKTGSKRLQVRAAERTKCLVHVMSPTDALQQRRRPLDSPVVGTAPRPAPDWCHHIIAFEFSFCTAADFLISPGQSQPSGRCVVFDCRHLIRGFRWPISSQIAAHLAHPDGFLSIFYFSTDLCQVFISREIVLNGSRLDRSLPILHIFRDFCLFLIL
jgi:hypothetical protein